MELASLLHVQPRRNKHLINLHATFEVAQESGKAFYLLFPWANGDLWSFWKQHTVDEENRIRLLSWMFGQCHGLAEALDIIHGERFENLPQFRASNLIRPSARQEPLYGNHGDIKAENVLWFEEGGKVRLALTDFGLGHLHTKVSRSNQSPEGILGVTKTYQPPEFDFKAPMISRVSDVFPLGCVFLEFATWYLEGHHSAADEFPRARQEDSETPSSFMLDTFFQVNKERGPNGEETAIIKPKVHEWVEKLRNNPHCSGDLGQFLDLILRMLDPNPDTRIKTQLVVKELATLLKACEIDPR